jgi:hypothetical protein
VILNGVLILVSGLLVSSKNKFKMEFEHLKLIENFQELDLPKKYGFSFGWYTYGQNINVILKHENKGENQIYLAETKLEVEATINKLLSKLVEHFNVTIEDQKKMCNLLKEHGCCYF